MTFRSRTATIRPSGSLRQDVHVRSRALDHGRPDEHRVHGRVAQERHGQLRLERLQLPPERVALHGHVQQRQDGLLVAGDLARQDDHPRARPEQRRAARGKVQDRPAHPPAVDQPAHGRALAPGQDQAVDVLEMLRQAHLDRLHADGAQDREMLGEGALEGQHADLHRTGSGPGGPTRPPTSRGPRGARCSGIASMAMPRIGAPRPLETSAMIFGVVEVGRGLDDGVRHARRVLGLEDAGADEHALGAQLHHQRGVGRGGDAAGRRS